MAIFTIKLAAYLRRVHVYTTGRLAIATGNRIGGWAESQRMHSLSSPHLPLYLKCDICSNRLMWNHNFLFTLIIYSQHAPLLRLQFCLTHSARVWAPSRLVCIYLHVISTSNLQTWKGRLVKKYFASPSPLHLSLTISLSLSSASQS